MAVFNVVQKRRRAAIAEHKRAAHGHPVTGKLKLKPQTTTISGKRKRKLFKKWRRDQKEDLAKGLITMQDVEMAVADAGPSQDAKKTSPAKFLVKKSLKIKSKRSHSKGIGKRKSHKAALEEAPADSMVE